MAEITIDSKVRKAFIMNLYNDSEFTMTMCEQMVFIINNYEKQFLNLFGQVMNKIENEYALNYDGANQQKIRRRLDYFNSGEYETHMFRSMSDYMFDNHLPLRNVVSGIMDFIFYCDLTKKYSLPNIGLINIFKGFEPKLKPIKRPPVKGDIDYFENEENDDLNEDGQFRFDVRTENNIFTI